MDEICGAGYRKALEFLLKDYAIYIAEEDAKENVQEDANNMLLGQFINKYFINPIIGSFAKVSSWIGNDEIHYYKKK